MTVTWSSTSQHTSNPHPAQKLASVYLLCLKVSPVQCTRTLHKASYETTFLLDMSFASIFPVAYTVIACLLLHGSALPPPPLADHSRVEAPPPGIKPAIYNCTSPADTLSLNVSGSMVTCGSVAGQPKTFLTKDIKTQPGISLGNALPEGLYAAFLLNPLSGPGTSFVSPILHTAAGNIRGSSLVDGEFGSADTISAFFPPNPPIPSELFQYVYLVFSQPNKIDWTDVAKLGTKKFPIEKVASEKNLTLVASNYFTAKKEW